MAEKSKELHYVAYSYEDPAALIPRTRNGFVFYDGPLETKDDIRILRNELTTARRDIVVPLFWKRIQ